MSKTQHDNVPAENPQVSAQQSTPAQEMDVLLHEDMTDEEMMAKLEAAIPDLGEMAKNKHSAGLVGRLLDRISSVGQSIASAATAGAEDATVQSEFLHMNKFAAKENAQRMLGEWLIDLLWDTVKDYLKQHKLDSNPVLSFIFFTNMGRSIFSGMLASGLAYLCIVLKSRETEGSLMYKRLGFVAKTMTYAAHHSVYGRFDIWNTIKSKIPWDIIEQKFTDLGGSKDDIAG